ncbi:hypothetical protein R5R35_012186 [Gryllus longicercus]|uniref:WD repeat-containing protein 60 n=1 Tax=Gryllus longicercus TaxID=2509291 RepID=A0AAN9ZBQ4_9ORTH
MPPDRGSTTRTQKTDIKRELSTSRKTKKTGDVNNEISTKGRQDARVTTNSLARQKAKVKKEENPTVSSTDKVTKSSRVDAAKLKDVKKDINSDLKRVRETLSRNRTIKNAPNKPTATRASVSEKISEGSISRRISNDSVRNKKVSGTPSSSNRVLQTSSTRSKTDLNKHVESSPRTRLGRSVNRQESVSSKTKEKHTSHDSQPKKLSRERTRTRTLSPHEVKTAQSISSLDMQKIHKSSKRTNDIATVSSVSDLTRSGQGPSNEPEKQSFDEAGDNYEDDFEEYESDFEEDVSGSSEGFNSVSELTNGGEGSSAEESSASEEDEVLELVNRPLVEEEKKLDSGNYDLTESKRKSGDAMQAKDVETEFNVGNRKGKEIQQIKEALEKENAGVSPRGTNVKNSIISHFPVARDEGFEEEKPNESKFCQGLKKAGIINFASAKKKMEEQKVTAKAKKRGEELLSMIRLDTVGFSLLDLPPVPYEVYMKSYGRSNTQQASVQTNEDNLSEEIQTEEIIVKNKWTQHPVAYHPVVDKDDANASLVVFSQNHLGCGGDGNEDPEMWKKLIKYNAVRLNQFLLGAGQAILQHLEQQSFIQENSLSLNSVASYFSRGFFNLNVNAVPFLAGRSVSKLCFSNLQPTSLITVHIEPNNSLEAVDAILGRCMLCIWNILKPSAPEKILVCSNSVSSVCFHQNVDNLVFAGLHEGTVCVWDLKESAAVHCLGDRVACDWVIRSPTYSTAEILKSEGHLTEVTALCAIGSTFSDMSSLTSSLAPIQICSLEISGVAIVWTVIQSSGTGLKTGLVQQDLGLAYWGKVRLVRSIVINIFDGLELNSNFLPNIECRDMITDPADPSHFYVCTNSGYIVHCLSSGCKPHPKVYSSNEGGLLPTTCMENMVDHNYMLIGLEGGIVQLYCRNSRNPLATYAGTADVMGQGPSIESIQASSVHPAQFFILDKLSRIHIWNLTESDIVPVKSLNFEKKILSMKLSKPKENEPMYLAIAMANGDVELYQLKPEFCFKSTTQFNEELQGFIAYAKEL